MESLSLNSVGNGHKKSEIVTHKCIRSNLNILSSFTSVLITTGIPVCSHTQADIMNCKMLVNINTLSFRNSNYNVYQKQVIFYFSLFQKVYYLNMIGLFAAIYCNYDFNSNYLTIYLNFIAKEQLRFFASN